MNNECEEKKANPLLNDTDFEKLGVEEATKVLNEQRLKAFFGK